jgi:hypothetical protein
MDIKIVFVTTVLTILTTILTYIIMEFYICGLTKHA